MKMSKKYEDMSFDELQEVYRDAVGATKKFNEKIRELNESIKAAGREYKKLQAELDELEKNPVPEGVYREERVLSLIGERILDRQEDPATEDPATETETDNPRRGRKVKTDD
jgi:uncharacterized protein (DUF342 family)